jgi:protein-S-isoprenylcysteine O-methyltransferase Ste14
MNDITYRLLLLALLAGFVIHRGIQTRRATPTQGQIAKKLELGRSEKIANLLSLVALLSSLIYIVMPTWIQAAQTALPAWLRWTGVGQALLGFGLMHWAQTSLGRNWSDMPVQLKEHRFVTAGPYRWMRHPIYTGFLLILSAPLLITANWLVGLSWMLATYIDVNVRINAEERMLEEQFGAAFKAHKAQTGRLLPKLLK